MEQSKSQKPSLAASILAKRGAALAPKGEEIKSESRKSLSESFHKEKSLAQKILAARKKPVVEKEYSLEEILEEEEKEALSMFDEETPEEEIKDSRDMSLAQAILAKLKKKKS